MTRSVIGGLHRIYLDTNVYCRPRDDRSQSKIDFEALALEEIASLKEKGKVLIVSSDYVKMELEEIEDEEKREDVVNFERSLSGENVEDSDELKHLSSMIVRTCNVGVLDALHLCSAVVGNAEFFLTCDEDIINKRSCIIKVLRNKGHVINMLNPVQYLESVWGIRVERSQK